MNVKSTFLSGVFEEFAYVNQLLRYMKSGKGSKVLKLKKELYRLKQAPRAWNTPINTYFKKKKYYNTFISMHCT